jgi:hypothetical protein
LFFVFLVTILYFLNKLDENGIKLTAGATAIESRFITADRADGTYSRQSIIEDAKRKVDTGERGANQRIALSDAEKRNEEFIRQQKLAPERKEYEALRAKEISSTISAEKLTDVEQKRITELYEKLLPQTEETFTNANDDNAVL